MPNKLHFYTKYSKEKIKISDKPLASGGEGAIYAIASPHNYKHLVAKIFYPDKRTAEREEKMQYLKAHPPMTFAKKQHTSIGWIQDLVYKDQRFLGILLIRIEGKKLTKLTLAKLPRRADKAWQRFAFQDPEASKLRLRTCFNLAVVIYQIHESGQYVLVDLKPDNILMQPNGLVAVIDMDSVEVVENGKALFSAPVATPEYTPPEHYSAPRTVIEETWDRFSLGVIFYQLLLGLHPFAASCHAPYDNLVGIDDKIQHDLYVHNMEKKDLFKVIPPPHQRFEQLPVEVQELFQNCFVLGAKNLLLRPAALDWCLVLANVLDLPFKVLSNKPPKIDIPPSTLYFLPVTFSSHLELNLDYNPTPLIIPDLDLSALDLIPQMGKKSSEVKDQILNFIKVYYKKHLRQHRFRLILGLLSLVLFGSFLSLFPLLLLWTPILLIWITFLVQKKFINVLEKNIYPTVFLNLLDKRETLTEKNKTTGNIYQTLLKKTQDIKQEVIQMEATQSLLDAIKIGLKEQADLKQEIKEFNHWIKETLHPILEKTRKKELDTYKTTQKAFSEEFSENFSKINVNKFRQNYIYSKAAFEKKILTLEKKINHLTQQLPLEKEALSSDYEKKINQIHKDHALQFKVHYNQLTEKTAQEIELLEETFNSFLKKEVHITFVNEEQASLFKEKEEELETELSLKTNQLLKERESIIKEMKSRFGKKFKSKCKPYLTLISRPLHTVKLNAIIKEFQKQRALTQIQIKELNIDKHLSQQLLNLFQPPPAPITITEARSYNPDRKVLSSLQKEMNLHYLDMENAFEQLKELIKEQMCTPVMLENDALINTWPKKVEQLVLSIYEHIEEYLTLQDHFFSEFHIFNFFESEYAYIENQEKIEKLKEQHQFQLNQLARNLKREMNLDFLEQKKALEERLKEDLDLYTQTWNEKKERFIQETDLAYQQKVQNLAQKILTEKKALQEELKSDKKQLTELTEDYESIQEALEQHQLRLRSSYQTILNNSKAESESIYAKYDTIYQDKLALLEENHEQYVSGYQYIANQIKTHQTEYEKSLKYIAAYPQKLDALKELIEKEQETLITEKEDKIKIETLLEWKENYSTKIYIKDLLLNKVEQFKKKENKNR